MDNGLIYLKGTTILDVKGLEYSKTNEYLDALNSYSEALSQKFKTLNAPTFQVISVEEKN